jgi:hypothetical protein
MKKEFEKKLRGTDYYIAVAKKVMEKKAVSKKELVIICDQVDKEQGYRKRDARAIDFSIDKFEKIFHSGSKLLKDVQKTPEAERGRGHRLTIPVYCLEDMTEEELKKYVSSYYKEHGPKKVKKSSPVPTITEKDRVDRDAKIRAAEELRKSNPMMTQKESIKASGKKIRLTVKMIRLAGTILEIAAQSENWVVQKRVLNDALKGKVVKAKDIKNLQETLNYYGVRFFTQFITVGAGWNLKLINDPVQTLDNLRDLTRKKFPKEKFAWMENVEKVKRMVVNSEISLSRRVAVVRIDTPNAGDRLTPYVKRLIFSIGGIIQINDGRFINVSTIIGILENNNYFRAKESVQSLFDIVKQFPDFFARSQGTDRNAIGFADQFKRTEIWNKIKELCSPKNQVKEIPWLINSGLTLDEIKEYFPESYVEHPEYNSSVITIKMTESIDNFMQLGQLYQKMRKCDVPLCQNEDLIGRLKVEVRTQRARLKAMYKKEAREYNWAKPTDDEKKPNIDNDKLLYTIEETL